MPSGWARKYRQTPLAVCLSSAFARLGVTAGLPEAGNCCLDGAIPTIAMPLELLSQQCLCTRVPPITPHILYLLPPIASSPLLSPAFQTRCHIPLSSNVCYTIAGPVTSSSSFCPDDIIIHQHRGYRNHSTTFPFHPSILSYLSPCIHAGTINPIKCSNRVLPAITNEEQIRISTTKPRTEPREPRNHFSNFAIYNIGTLARTGRLHDFDHEMNMHYHAIAAGYRLASPLHEYI